MLGISCENASGDAGRPEGAAREEGGPMKQGLVVCAATPIAKASAGRTGVRATTAWPEKGLATLPPTSAGGVSQFQVSVVGNSVANLTKTPVQLLCPRALTRAHAVRFQHCNTHRTCHPTQSFIQVQHVHARSLQGSIQLVKFSPRTMTKQWSAKRNQQRQEQCAPGKHGVQCEGEQIEVPTCVPRL